MGIKAAQDKEVEPPFGNSTRRYACVPPEVMAKVTKTARPRDKKEKDKFGNRKRKGGDNDNEDDGQDDARVNSKGEKEAKEQPAEEPQLFEDRAITEEEIARVAWCWQLSRRIRWMQS